MKQKAKLTLDLLEKELELISKEEAQRTTGGMGVVTSGADRVQDLQPNRLLLYSI